jgi:hypothetical protein
MSNTPTPATKIDPSQWSPARRRIEAQIPDHCRSDPGRYLTTALRVALGITEHEAVRRLQGRDHEPAEDMEAYKELDREIGHLARQLYPGTQR